MGASTLNVVCDELNFDSRRSNINLLCMKFNSKLSIFSGRAHKNCT